MTGILSGKCAIVTGAADGIGRAIALRFHAEGASIMAVDRADFAFEGLVNDDAYRGADRRCHR